jgi:tRNA A37 threonylcarbamoyladenosine modification protein TsaB
MILIIDRTLDDHNVYIAIEKDGKIIIEKKFAAKYAQAEKLLPEVDKLLKKSKIKLADIKEIRVENRGGTFTSLRIGVITANALGYALGVLVNKVKNKNNINIVKPEYNREPIIG